MIMTPPSGTNPVIHTLNACKTACSESERQAQEAQAEANAERLMREESEVDNQKLENKYEQAERKLQQAMDDRDRAQRERDSAINGKAQSEQDWHRVLMPLKEKLCTEWERGQEARFERLRNSITEDFNKQLADHQKTITDHQKTSLTIKKRSRSLWPLQGHQKEITELMATTRIICWNTLLGSGRSGGAAGARTRVHSRSIVICLLERTVKREVDNRTEECNNAIENEAN
ncbi:hypothetical protein BGX38DRAFT_910831 [Terfezia claveryi]|nr:hypothetical protein BGX38DRAFT_910831 [Terfezia claveryi]